MYTKTKKIDHNGYIGYTGLNAYHAKNSIKKALDKADVKYVRIEKSNTGSYYIIGAEQFDEIRVSNHTQKMDWFTLNKLTAFDFVHSVKKEEFDGYGVFNVCTQSCLEALINKLS